MVQALLFSENPTPELAERSAQAVLDEQQRLQEDLNRMEQLALPSDVRTAIVETRAPFEAYAHLAGSLVRESFQDRAKALEDYEGFRTQFEDLEGRLERLTTERLAPALRRAEEHAAQQQATIRVNLVKQVVAVMASGLLVMSALTRHFLRNLEEVRLVARKLGGGDLSARNEDVGRDEVGDIARAFNDLGDNLQQILSQKESEGERNRFTNQLTDALDMAEQESAVSAVVKRAMTMISDRPTTMMMADNSNAHMRVVASSPAGAAGCGVESPWSCIAVRRAAPLHFSSSENLNACPRLRGEGKPACSATCVPVSFMGKSVGVLHSVGPDQEAADPERLQRLTILANQAGARVGTLRAMEKIQLQVSTDSLTGLFNRRTLENKVGELQRDNVPFAVVMLDLDHFKKLNDTFGHEAGDRALRHFGQLLRSTKRGTDICGRYGGEEFVVILPHTTAVTAAEVMNRLRSQLAASFHGDTPRFTLSCGVADTDVAGTFQRVLRAADAAAYQSKQGGRDRVTLWQVGMSIAPDGNEVAANFGIEEADVEEAAELQAGA